MSASGSAQCPQRVEKRPSVETNMRLLSPNKGATHGCVNEDHRTRYAVEQRRAARPEATAEAEGDLGYPDSVTAGIIEPGNSHCSTLPSTANCAGVIWSRCASTMWSKAVTSLAGRLSCRRKPSDQCNSRSPSKRGMQ